MAVILSQYAKDAFISFRGLGPEAGSPFLEGNLLFDEVRVTFVPLNTLSVHESQIRTRMSFVWQGKLVGYIESLPMERGDMLTLHGVKGALVLKAEP